MAREHALAERIDELEEEVRQLREQLVPTRVFPPELRLTKTESAVLSFILARAPAAAMKARIHFAVYPDPDTAPDLKLIDVMAFKLRRKLQPLGITLATVWGEGYVLDRVNAERLNAVLKGESLAFPAPLEAPLALPPPPLQIAPPAPDPLRPGFGLSALQIRTIKGFASAGRSPAFIARQVDEPLRIVKMVLKGV